MRPQMDDQVLPYAERLATHFANMWLLTRVYTHVGLQIRFAAHGFAAHFASDLILARVYLKMHLQRGLPVALEITDVAFVLLSLAVGLHMHVEIGCARVSNVAYFANEWFLASVHKQVTLQRLICVETLAAYIAMNHVFLIMLLLVKTQIVSGNL